MDQAKVSDAALQHVAKVHLVAGLGVAVSGIGSYLHMTDIISAGDHMTIAQVILALIVAGSYAGCNSDGLSPWRFVVLMACALCAGVNMGSWMQGTLMQNKLCYETGWNGVADKNWLHDMIADGIPPKCDITNTIILEAFELTAMIYSGFVLAAVLAPTKSLFWLISFVQVSLLALTAQYWLSRLGFTFFVNTFDLVNVRCGIALFAIKTAVDTQIIISKHDSETDRDIVSHALTMMMNFLNLFVRIVRILGTMAAKAKKD